MLAVAENKAATINPTSPAGSTDCVTRMKAASLSAPWNLQGVKLAPGLRAVYAVAVKPDGSQVTSRCTFPIVKAAQPGK